MRKDLYNFLTVHHFFDIAIDGCDIFLLCDKVFGTECADLFGRKQCDTDHQECTIVRGTFKSSMLTNTLTMVMMLFKNCGILWLIIWRSVSISFV